MRIESFIALAAQLVAVALAWRIHWCVRAVLKRKNIFYCSAKILDIDEPPCYNASGSQGKLLDREVPDGRTGNGAAV